VYNQQLLKSRGNVANSSKIKAHSAMLVLLLKGIDKAVDRLTERRILNRLMKYLKLTLLANI
jgi:hypothetical protein